VRNYEASAGKSCQARNMLCAVLLDSKLCTISANGAPCVRLIWRSARG
jgi:hypothetical protein